MKGKVDMELWYEQSASEWMQALPVGNGRMGAMVFSGIDKEVLALDEETVWAGHPADANKTDAYKSLDQIRQLLFDGKVTEAKALTQEQFTGYKKGYGTHLRAGELVMHTGCAVDNASGYKRQLDLETAVVSTEYSVGNIRYRRETFASYVDKVVVQHFEADKSGSVNLKLCLQSDREDVQIIPQDALLVLKAHCHDGGVHFAIAVKPILKGGTLTADETSIHISNANSVTLLIDIASDFRSEDYLGQCQTRLREAAQKTYNQLKKDHVADYQALFNRVSFSLGQIDRSKLPTDLRLKAFQSGLQDNGLIADFFQYGRYLTIASSRPGTLASHLQGVWNDNKASMMAWTCDYHLDINTQMNYWPAEVCNLSECHEPAFHLIESLVEPGRKTAKAFYNCPGWVAHVFTNLWGYTTPGWSERWGGHITGGLWLALHMADHYNFTEDEKFLRDRAYPVLKAAALFFEHLLVPEPKNGWLVTCPSLSPENVYRTADGQEASVCAGPTCDSVLLYELFDFCTKAAQILDVDEDLQDRWQEVQSKLPPYQLTKDGRIREWLEDYEEPEPNHRHTTHLLGLFPFPQIFPDRTPGLAKAARRVLEYKMSLPNWEDTEWCRAWNICFYARLQDGQGAYENIQGLLNITDRNLLTFSPPHGGAVENIFVLDGNAGGTAGIAEMLLQSYNGVLHILPALPKQWPDGYIKGLRGREGYELDIYWQGGKLKKLEIRSDLSCSCRIKYADQVIEIRTENGKADFTGDGFVIQLWDARKKKKGF